jgi:hypothetical protein
MINKGRVLAQGSIQDLTDRLWKAVPLEMEFLNPPQPGVMEKIRAMEGVTVESLTGNLLTLRVSQRDLVPAVIGTAVHQGARIFRVTPRNYTLEEIYFAVQEQGGSAA